MVVKVYISGISGNKEVKKRQQRVLMILDSKNVKYEIIDITEPGRESDKDFMQHNSLSNGGTVSDPNPRSPLPPQVFNEEEYCGDYDKFDLANEVDTLEQFLKVEVPPESLTSEETENKTNAVNGDVKLDTEKAQQDTEDRTKETLPDDVKEEDTKDDTIERTKGDSVEKEISPERKLSVDETPEESKEKTTDETDVNLVEEETISKEEAINENGAVSSREVSEEKESQETVEPKKDNPSEALIQSEQAVASD